MRSVAGEMNNHDFLCLYTNMATYRRSSVTESAIQLVAGPRIANDNFGELEALCVA